MRAPSAVSSVAQKKLHSPMVNKRKADADGGTKDDAKKKDDSTPKRPPSAFILFMEDFRKTYKENFPEKKSVANVSKAGGKKWKSMSDSEKATYVATAAMKKMEYVKLMEDFDMKKTDVEKQITPDESSISTTSEITNETEREGSS